MVIDITGTILTPGNLGKDCMGNRQHPETECCCEECDYMLCCLENHTSADCENAKIRIAQTLRVL